MSLFTRWIEVKCQAIHHGKTCGKVHVHAVPGSKVRFRCHRCKTLQVIDVTG
jgi:phage FluMu protein Com